MAMTARVWTLALLSVLVVVSLLACLVGVAFTDDESRRTRVPGAGSRERSARVDRVCLSIRLEQVVALLFLLWDGVCVCVCMYVASYIA